MYFLKNLKSKHQCPLIHTHLLLTDETTLCPPLCAGPTPHSSHPGGDGGRHWSTYMGSAGCFGSVTHCFACPTQGCATWGYKKPWAFCRWKASEWAHTLHKRTWSEHMNKFFQLPPAWKRALSAEVPGEAALGGRGRKGGGRRKAIEGAQGRRLWGGGWGRYQQLSRATKLHDCARSVRRCAMSPGGQRPACAAGPSAGPGRALAAGVAGRRQRRRCSCGRRLQKGGKDRRALSLVMVFSGGGLFASLSFCRPPHWRVALLEWYRNRVSQVKGWECPFWVFFRALRKPGKVYVVSNFLGWLWVFGFLNVIQ